jgi:hypothetical protein
MGLARQETIDMPLDAQTDTTVAISENRAVAAAETPTASASLLAIVARAASDPACDVDKMQALLNMQERILANQARNEFNAAFARLSGRLPRIKKNGEVLHGQGDKKTLAYKFARWEDVMRLVRPLMEEEGFSLSFESASRPVEGGGMIVTGHLMHVAGHTQSASMDLPLDTGPGRSNIQSRGSTLSYGQRYVTKMLLNLVFEGEDDDGQEDQGYVTPDQIAQLELLLLETGSNITKWLEVIGAPSVEEIKFVAFPTAKNSLLRKKEQIEARKRQGAAP